MRAFLILLISRIPYYTPRVAFGGSGDFAADSGVVLYLEVEDLACAVSSVGAGGDQGVLGAMLAPGEGNSLPFGVKALEGDSGYVPGGEGAPDPIVASLLEALGGKVVVAIIEGAQGEVSGLAVRFIVLQLIGFAVA